MPKVSDIEGFLRAESELITHLGYAMHGYYGLSDFVLKHGANMPAPERGLPCGIARGKMGKCFENAGTIAIFSDRYIYCEGYALAIIPVLHAWLWDRKTEQVIDPTWQGRRDYKNICYYGIAIKKRYLQTQCYDNKHWGLIDLPVERWPMLRLPVSKWRHPVMNKIHKNNC